MKKQKNIKNKKGVTLAELVVFIAVFSVFLLLIAMIFKSIIQGQRFMKSRVDIKHNAAIALDFLCRDIMAAQAVKVNGQEVWPGPPGPTGTVSLNNYEIAVDYSKPMPTARFYYKIETNSEGIKQLLRKRVPVNLTIPLTEPKYDVAAEFIDDVIITKLYGGKTGSTYTKESYKIKVTAKSTGIRGVPEGVFSLISQVTPRSIGTSANNIADYTKVTPVAVEDKTARKINFTGIKPAL